MKLMNKKKTGFTLIELIIVIVILGILAVTAAPKFLNLQGDANASTIKGVDGAINSAMSIVYGKAIIADKQSSTGESLTINGDTINIEYGYPEASDDGVAEMLDIDIVNDFSTSTVATTLEYVIRAKGSTAPTVVAASDGDSADTTSDGCYVSYKEAADADTPPVVIVNTDKC
jgi:MSHA pilin protein MshA